MISLQILPFAQKLSKFCQEKLQVSANLHFFELNDASSPMTIFSAKVLNLFFDDGDEISKSLNRFLARGQRFCSTVLVAVFGFSKHSKPVALES